jgi:hypothetical protein
MLLFHGCLACTCLPTGFALPQACTVVLRTHMAIRGMTRKNAALTHARVFGL